MKKILLSVICLSLFSCQKKNDSSPVPTVQTIESQIGLQLNHPYYINVITSISPQPIQYNEIIFNSNNTITEIDTLYNDSFVYSVIYYPSYNNSTSLLQNGVALKIIIPSDSFGTPYTYGPNEGFYTYNWYQDSCTLGVYTSGPIVQNSKPTLGCMFTRTINGVTYYGLLTN